MYKDDLKYTIILNNEQKAVVWTLFSQQLTRTFKVLVIVESRQLAYGVSTLVLNFSLYH